MNDREKVLAAKAYALRTKKLIVGFKFIIL